MRTGAESRVGRVLRAKYTLERLIGEGGMAAVYLAVHRNGRRFAIKLLHPEISRDEAIRTRFLREGRAANSVNHRGAVAVLDDDVDERDGSAFLVMELLEGASIDALAKQHGGRLPVQTVLSLTEELLDVLDAAHRNGIVHRDLKPANLFLTRDGELKVLDFGIARVREPLEAKATSTGQMLGTPAFMAPEQAFGRSEEIDARTDLWAVGATLFTLLSGQDVIEADTMQELLVKLATGSTRSLASVSPALPAEVIRLVDGALQPDREQRYEDVAAMQSALAQAVHALGPRFDRATALRGLFAQTRAAPLRRHAAPALSLLVISLVGGWLLAPRFVRRAQPLAPLASASRDSRVPPPAITEDAAVPVKKLPAKHAGEPHVVVPRVAAPAICARYMERMSMGEELSQDERAKFRQECTR